MPSFYAGQRLPAGHLNALSTLSAPVSGGPTSGTTALTVGTLTVPPAPIDRWVTPSLAIRLSIDTADARYGAEIINTRIGNTVGFGQLERAANNFPTATVLGAPFLLLAEDDVTFTVQISRLGGTGTASTQTGFANRLVVEMSAVQ